MFRYASVSSAGNINGTVEYVETHNITTNQFGLINIQIGKGTSSQGVFSEINWGANLYFSKIEIDINDTNGYQVIGTSQMLAVPYALYAAKAYDTDFNFIITGIKDVSCNIDASLMLPINLHWISGEQHNVVLSASGIPEGVNIEFEEPEGSPDFATNMNIVITQSASAGVYPISVTGTAGNGRIRTYTFDLEINSVLSAEFTIKDATTWTPENPSMNAAASATIKLYASQLSFDDNMPEYTFVADNNGFAKTHDIVPGDYLMLVEKDNLSNVVDGYLIAGIFQSQQEVDNSPQQDGATVGGLKFSDVNGDYVVNSDDKVYGDNITISAAETLSKTVVIGENSGSGDTFWTEENIENALGSCIEGMNDFTRYEFMFDGIFTGTASTSDMSWSFVSNRNLLATDSKINDLWTSAYAAISQINTVIKGAQESGLDQNISNRFIAEAKVMRAYLYYNLVNWFDGVPLLLASVNPGDHIARNTVEEVYAQIISDLQSAQPMLSYASPEYVSNYFALGLLSRIYAQQQDWNNLSSTAGQLIDAGQFSLTANPGDAFVTSSVETVFGFDKGSDTWFNNFFTKGDYVPAIRYTETLLLRAEALLQTGQTTDAIALINQLRTRRSESSLDGSQTTEELRQELLNKWEAELGNEGTWFFALKRFDRAMDNLQIQQHNLILPIPQSEVDTNPYMTQNPGY